MPKLRKRSKNQTPQAEEFLLALERAKEGGSKVKHQKNLAEWRFIDSSRHDCAPEEKRYLLEYELAREAEALGIGYRSTGVWQAAFGSRFPEAAFLSIEPAERRSLLRAAFSDRGTRAPLFDFTTEWQGISYQFNYILKPEYQAELEATVTEAREAANVGPEEHAVDIAVVDFMGHLPAEAYDQSIAHIQMTINFDYSDDRSSDAFTKLLTSLRRGDSKPGKKDEVDAHLKQLAVTRLYRIFGTVQAAQNYLTDCDFDLPYTSDAGWSKAKAAVRKLIGAEAAK